MAGERLGERYLKQKVSWIGATCIMCIARFGWMIIVSGFNLVQGKFLNSWASIIMLKMLHDIVLLTVTLHSKVWERRYES